MLYSAQLRAARTLLGWSQQELSTASGVGLVTIYRVEKGNGPAMANMSTLVRLRSAFEQAGVQFLAEDERGGIGVRFAPASAPGRARAKSRP